MWWYSGMEGCKSEEVVLFWEVEEHRKTRWREEYSG